MNNYTIAWTWCGRKSYLDLRTHDAIDALYVYVNAACLQDWCNELYCNGRLVARQATYQGV